jgi:NAD-dependent SIR2 family protein deacetylase
MTPLNNAKALLDDADAVLVSASNGLSISEGVNIFANDQNFKDHFGDFEKYGIHNILQGAMGQLQGETKEKFHAALDQYLRKDYVPSRAMLALKDLLGSKPYFILTLTADDHFRLAGLNPERIWELEGNFFENKPQSPTWKHQEERFHQFMDQFASKKVVHLELGLGGQNQNLRPQLIQLVREMPHWTMVTVNTKEGLYIPSSIKDRTVGLAGDVTDILEELRMAEPNPDFLKELEDNKVNFSYDDLVTASQMNYSRYGMLYARGGTAFKLSEKPMPSYEEQIEILSKKIDEADHIVIGAASGLSAAGGGDFYYTDSPSFYKYFGKFNKKYGIKGAFAGMQYPFPTREEYWGYLATFLYTTQHAGIRSPYKTLQKLLKDKDYFIITTNQDTQAIKAFPEDHVAELQGDHRFFQCSRACTDDTWDAVKPVEDMVKAMGDGTAVPKELIPRCPHCGAEAFPWVRGYGNFLQGKKYDEQYEKATKDIWKHRHDKILFLELGVGRMTPMFIQEPFWLLTKELPDAYDVMINLQYQMLPEMIENKGTAIKGDLDKVLSDAAKYKGL